MRHQPAAPPPDPFHITPSATAKARLPLLDERQRRLPTAQLNSHVSSMYSHLDQGVEVTCMSPTLPTLFANANGYRRQLTLTPQG